MKQLCEVRHNPVYFPSKEADKVQPAHELIFITGRRSYEIGLNNEAKQVQETVVFRCMATIPAIHNTILALLQLLPADDMIAQAVTKGMEMMEEESSKNAQPDLFNQPTPPAS